MNTYGLRIQGLKDEVYVTPDGEFTLGPEPANQKPIELTLNQTTIKFTNDRDELVTYYIEDLVRNTYESDFDIDVLRAGTYARNATLRANGKKLSSAVIARIRALKAKAESNRWVYQNFRNENGLSDNDVATFIKNVIGNSKFNRYSEED